jgi:hypothetical protein
MDRPPRGRGLNILKSMQCTALLCLVVLAGPVIAADDENGFISLLSRDQLGRWSGDREFWAIEPDKIHGKSARQSTPLVYDGRTFADHVLRFSAQVQKGSIWVFLRNVPFAWTLEIDTGRISLRGGGGNGFVAFLNKPGEWASYEVRVRGGSVTLLRNGERSGFDYNAGHMPETGKVSLQLPEASQGSEVVLRGLRIRPDP